MKHRVLLICAMVLFGTSSVMAVDVGYKYDNEVNRVVISGNLDWGKERISLQVYNKEAFDTYAPDAAVDKENIDNVLVYSAQGYTGENGEFSFSFPLKETSGSYVARIGAASITDVLDYGFYYTEPGEEAAILGQLKNITTAQALMEYVEGDSPNDILIFNPDSAYAGVYNKLAIYQRLIGDAEYDSLTEFSALFAASTRLQEVNEINDENTLLAKLLEYNSLSGIADAPFYKETYADLTSEQNMEILSDVMQHSDFDSFENIYQYMGEQTILCAIKYNDWNVAQAVMRTNESFFLEDVSRLFSENDAKREKAAKAVAGKDFTGFDLLEDAVKKAFEPTKNNNSGSTGGGGGAGGASVQLPATTHPTTVAKQEMPFADIDGFEWAMTAIESLWRKAVVSGVDKDTFQPEKEVTREEFVAMIVRNFGLLNNKAECDFTDIDKDDWCYSAVASAYKAGIVFGIDEDTFGKGTKITRQDMCVIAHRAAELAGITFDEKAELPFEDEMSDYATEQIKAFYASGIISGFDERLFGAFNNSNRAQAAVVIYKINEYANEKE